MRSFLTNVEAGVGRSLTLAGRTHGRVSGVEFRVIDQFLF